ncbi:MAG: AmmeMemoRadiSam system protein B, partial [Candidatus Aminicenantes bacterium]|nr:AmmeMemoRadiSam system protein B [Candidatus Aminicenantes bacterium]
MGGGIPKLRSDIEFIPTSYEGEQAVLVRDSLGLIPEPAMIHGDSLKMLKLIDGRNSVQDMQLIIMRNSGNVFIGMDVIQNFILELDAVFLLESPRYQEHKQKLIAEYASSDKREAHLAGKAYPQDAEELRAYLETVVTEGEALMESAERQDVCALVAPHIDLELGRRLYGMAYHSVRRASPRRVVLLGTGHSLSGAFFSLTAKDFVTPLGTQETDKRAVERLREIGGELICPHDLDHRHEHSLEFQLIFLQYLFGEEFTLVPLLC